MFERLPLALLVALPAIPACCFSPPVAGLPPPPVVPSAPTAQPVVAPSPTTPSSTVALPGAGQLPTPALTLTGIEGPLPSTTAAPHTPGAIRTSGTATVRVVTGSLAGVSEGTTCSFAQFEVDPAEHSFDCRWNVTCAGNVVYGLGTAGYQHCADPSWPPGVLMVDSEMTGSDGDPMFIFNSAGLTVRDDTGPLGAYSLTLTVP